MAIFVGGARLFNLPPKYVVREMDLRLVGDIGNCTYKVSNFIRRHSQTTLTNQGEDGAGGACLGYFDYTI